MGKICQLSTGNIWTPQRKKEQPRNNEFTILKNRNKSRFCLTRDNKYPTTVYGSLLVAKRYKIHVNVFGGGRDNDERDNQTKGAEEKVKIC